MLLSDHPGIIEQSVWTLGNIACDLPAYRDSIINAGGVTNLIAVIKVAVSQLSTTPSMGDLIETTGWALSTLCRNQPLPAYSKVKEAINMFYYLLNGRLIRDIKIVGNLCWAISYFSGKGNGKDRN